MGGKERPQQVDESQRNIVATHLMTPAFDSVQKYIVTSVFFVFFTYLCCSIFPSPEQNLGLSHYQGLLNTGGSLPDLSNLHFPSPLSTPLDPEDNGGYPNLSGGSSTGNLPAAMMHLGIGNSQGGWSRALCLCVVPTLLTLPPYL